MTSKRNVALRYWNYDSGVTHATAVAKDIVEAFPNGFDDEQINTIVANINQSEQSALEAIPKRFWEAFSAGYHVGIKTVLNRYRQELIATGIK